jgi:hypothetical protein
MPASKARRGHRFSLPETQPPGPFMRGRSSCRTAPCGRVVARRADELR